MYEQWECDAHKQKQLSHKLVFLVDVTATLSAYAAAVLNQLTFLCF